jgi:hypothetical protein
MPRHNSAIVRFCQADEKSQLDRALVRHQRETFFTEKRAMAGPILVPAAL